MNRRNKGEGRDVKVGDDEVMLLIEENKKPGVVAHICNPSYLGGREQRTGGL
jgi:hypothetical protein